MKTKADYSKEDWVKEFIALLRDVVRNVYLKDPDSDPEHFAIEEAESGWADTNMVPLRYLESIADPKRVTNQINRGQKARETRWSIWYDNARRRFAGEAGE